MTIIVADQRFAEALKISEAQIAETTQFWFAAATMNEVARRDTDTLNALNLTPSFWITARVAMEYQAILTASKIFGPRKTNPHNIDYLFQVVRETRAAAFSKDALEARKREGSANAAEWIGDYMKGVYVPTARDVNRLHELSKRHRKTYETQYADVRNLHVAHNVLVDANARWAMFQKTRIRDFEKLIVFLNQLHKVLREMYYNGQRPALRPMPYSVRSLVRGVNYFCRAADLIVAAHLAAKKLKDLRDGPTHEHIVAETRMCMSLITQAAKALPRGSRRALRWG